LGGDAPVERDEVMLRLASDCRSDFHAFWAGAKHERSPETDERELDAARSVLMEGCYDDWLLIPREMAVAELSRRLTRLMEACMADRHFNRAIRAALKLIEIDPLLEAPHRVIMRAHDRLGNRAAAIRQFRKLRADLAKELQVPPLEETVALYTEILGDEPRDLPTAARTLGEGPPDVIRDLLTAETRVRRARLRLLSPMGKVAPPA
jgi:DNA-binding SARP family transcriptional activator